MKRSFYIALATLILVLPGLFLLSACSAPNLKVKANKAAIVDEIYPLEPNQIFIDKATTILENSGFQVDIYHGDEITVDFYRNLPTLGYKVIIFRSHSGLQIGSAHLASGDMKIARTYLFTNELYSTTAHIGDQLADRLAKVRIDDNQPVEFGISADFILRSMQGNFDRTFVIMMGCSTLYKDDMAMSFVERGASAYTGWDASVGLDYVDNVTITLLERLFSNEASIESAVRDTMQEKTTDPNWGANLRYYPNTSGTKTLSELLQ